MNKIIKDNSTPTSPDWIFYCEGCKCHHGVWTSKAIIVDGKPNIWIFNGNENKPTFHPSIHVTRKRTGVKKRETICHSFVTNGEIRYLDDSKHHLKGQTVELLDID